MEQFSVSFTLGKASAMHGANVRHNNRDFTAANVDDQRTAENITYVKQDVRDAYHQLFDRALQDYNAKQKRSDRRIPDYFDHMNASNREEAFYEIVVQFGDCKTSPCGSERGEAAKQMLASYMRDFQRRNPNLFVFNAVLHMDEASPHLHIDVIPFYTKGRKNGLQKGVSMKAALLEQGFKPRGTKENQLVMWEFSERAEMERVLQTHGFAREDKNMHRRHLSVESYKLQQETERLLKMKAMLREKNTNESDTAKLQNELDASKQILAELEAERRSPVKAFYYSSSEKQLWVQQQLDQRQIPYYETENGFEARECYAAIIRRIERDYKAPRTSARDCLRDKIDFLLLRSRSFEELLDKLEKENYRIKCGKYIAVQPPHYGSFIRLKSLGEFYSENALRNRIFSKLEYEQNLAHKMQDAEMRNASNKAVLMTMQMYIISFSKGYMPVRKKDPHKLLTWQNDAVLDRLLSLNEKINQGATLESLRAEIAEQEKTVLQIERELEANSDMKDEIQMQKNAELLVAQQKLKDAADFLTIAEQVLGGTYLQTIGESERLRRESEYIQNGKTEGNGNLI